MQRAATNSRPRPHPRHTPSLIAASAFGHDACQPPPQQCIHRMCDERQKCFLLVILLFLQPPLLRQSITRTFVVAGSSRRSRQRTRKPRCASRAAMTAPIGPAPHTMARGASCDAPVVALCALARAVRRRTVGMRAVFERFTGIGRAAAAMLRCSESVTDAGVCREILICPAGLKFVAVVVPAYSSAIS